MRQREYDSEDGWVFWILVSSMWRALALFSMGNLNMGQLADGKQPHTISGP